MVPGTDRKSMEGRKRPCGWNTLYVILYIIFVVTCTYRYTPSKEKKMTAGTQIRMIFNMDRINQGRRRQL